MKPISRRWMNEDGTVDYNAYIHSHDWDLKRDERIEIDNHTCQVCGTNERTLQVHHLSYSNLGDEPMEDLITVCSVCHAIITEIEKTRLSDKIRIGLCNLEILKRQYEWAYRAMMECVVSKAVVRHINEIPEACGNYTTKLEPWISNIIECTRRNQQYHIQKAGVTPGGIAHVIADGTFRKGRTYEQNVNELTQQTVNRIEHLPSIPDWSPYGSED